MKPQLHILVYIQDGENSFRKWLNNWGILPLKKIIIIKESTYFLQLSLKLHVHVHKPQQTSDNGKEIECQRTLAKPR